MWLVAPLKLLQNINSILNLNEGKIKIFTYKRISKPTFLQYILNNWNLNDWENEKAYKGYKRSKNGYGIGIYDKNKLIGVAFYYPSRKYKNIFSDGISHKGIYLHLIDIVKKYQNQKIGSNIIKFIVAKLYMGEYLFIPSTQTDRHRKFYESNGLIDDKVKWLFYKKV